MYNNIIYSRRNNNHNNMNRFPILKLNMEDKNTIEENNKQIIILNETIKNMGGDIEKASNELNIMVQNLISLKNEKESIYMQINDILLKKVGEIPKETPEKVIEKKKEIKYPEKEEVIKKKEVIKYPEKEEVIKKKEIKYPDKKEVIKKKEENELKFIQKDLNILKQTNNDIDVIKGIDLIHKDKLKKDKKEKNKDIDLLLEKYINDTKS